MQDFELVINHVNAMTKSIETGLSDFKTEVRTDIKRIDSNLGKIFDEIKTKPCSLHFAEIEKTKQIIVSIQDNCARREKYKQEAEARKALGKKTKINKYFLLVNIPVAIVSVLNIVFIGYVFILWLKF